MTQPRDDSAAQPADVRPTVRSRATLGDIAEHAQVSSKTVSRVLNKERYVAEATRERVERAIAELQYVPDVMAAGLRRNTSGLVGVLVPDITNRFYADFARHLEVEIGGDGPMMILANEANSAARGDQHLQNFRAHRVDGMIVLTSGSELLEVAGQEVPTVLVDRLPGDRQMGLDAVVANDHDTAAALTAHLADEHGVTEIALLCGDTHSAALASRRDGYLAALAERDLQPHVHDDLQSPDEGVGHATEFLTGDGEGPRGIVTTSNRLLWGALRATREVERTVGADVLLATFDDVPEAAYAGIELTTAQVDMDDYAATAWSLLKERMQDRNAPVQRVVVRFEITHRASCGCPSPT